MKSQNSFSSDEDEFSFNVETLSDTKHDRSLESSSKDHSRYLVSPLKTYNSSKLQDKRLSSGYSAKKDLDQQLKSTKSPVKPISSQIFKDNDDIREKKEKVEKKQKSPKKYNVKKTTVRSRQIESDSSMSSTNSSKLGNNESVLSETSGKHFLSCFID